MPEQPLIVDVLRGGRLESAHRGALAIVDARGAVHTALGDVTRPVFPRSAVKLLQALPLVASGAADALGLTDAELALACASHNGEPEHAATAAAMLAKAGVDADVLECGAHWPMQEAAGRALAASGHQPGALHNNCSGKHAGFVCLACRRNGRAGLSSYLRGYVDAGHPLMREVRMAVQTVTGYDLTQAAPGIDGCSIPTYAIPLQALALAFARVASGQGLADDHRCAALRLRRAVAAAPFMVAGSGRFDTRVMQALGERVCCKVGAEGVYCAALPELGLGVAIKVDDGTGSRAAEVAMAHVIEALLPLAPEQAALLRSLSHVTLRNWRGVEVGAVQPAQALRAALPH